MLSMYVSICYSLMQNRNRDAPLDVTSKELESTLFNKVGITGCYGNSNLFLASLTLLQRNWNPFIQQSRYVLQVVMVTVTCF